MKAEIENAIRSLIHACGETCRARDTESAAAANRVKKEKQEAQYEKSLAELLKSEGSRNLVVGNALVIYDATYHTIRVESVET